MREQYLQLRSFPVQVGYYSDVGYRLKKNKLVTNDNLILAGGAKTKTFYEMDTYNEDTFIVPEAKLKEQKILADIYFRLSVNEVNHVRQVETLINFLGNVAGIAGLLEQLLIAAFGGYSAFYSNIRMI